MTRPQDNLYPWHGIKFFRGGVVTTTFLSLDEIDPLVYNNCTRIFIAKIDEVKEILNSLRLFFSLCVGLIVIITGALITKEQKNELDLYFWSGAVMDIFLIIVLFLLVKAIKKNTNIIKDL